MLGTSNPINADGEGGGILYSLTLSMLGTSNPINAEGEGGTLNLALFKFKHF